MEYYAYGTFSYLFASAGGPPVKLNEIKSVMLDEFRKLRSDSIRTEELKTVKRGLEIKYSVDSDDSMGTAVKIAEMELMYGDGRLYEKIPALIRKLDVGIVERYIDMYISLGRYGVITLSRN